MLALTPHDPTDDLLRTVGSRTQGPPRARPPSELKSGTVPLLDGSLGTLVLDFFAPTLDLLARSSSDNINTPLRSFGHYPKGGASP
jgi:hypothetical protein